jgi:hypothetical protein
VAHKGDPIYPKISFVKKFEPWGWMVGSGAYVADIDDLFWAQAKSFGGFVLLVSAALGLVSILIVRGISKPIAESARVMAEIEASGDLMRRMTIQGCLEAISISTAFNKMIASFSTVEQMRGVLQEKNTALQEAERKTNRELAIARALQSAILPESFPRAPGCDGAARMLPPPAWAVTSTTSSNCRAGASVWSWPTCRARACRRRFSWRWHAPTCATWPWTRTGPATACAAPTTCCARKTRWNCS